MSISMTSGSIAINAFLFFCLNMLLEFGIPQYMRLVGGFLFRSGLADRTAFFRDYRRGRLLRFVIALVDSGVAAFALSITNQGEIQGAILITTISVYGLVVAGAVWWARRHLNDSESV